MNDEIIQVEHIEQKPAASKQETVVVEMPQHVMNARAQITAFTLVSLMTLIVASMVHHQICVAKNVFNTHWLVFVSGVFWVINFILWFNNIDERRAPYKICGPLCTLSIVLSGLFLLLRNYLIH